MNEAHFNLHSWSSNSSSLREQAARDGTADTNKIVNILGLKWNKFLDILSLTPKNPYQPAINIVCDKSHRRPMIHLDVCPCNQGEWDELLPLDLRTKWHSIAEDIQKASKITLPRCYFLESEPQTSTTYLHVFADSSPKAYGAVTYVSNDHQSSLAMVKSHVAPLKELTSPQLVFMAALMGTRLGTPT